MKIRAKFTTGISFWEKTSIYVPGQGTTATWILYSEGTMTVFPCEWRMNLRTRTDEKFSGNAEGNVDFDKVRMPYIPRLYEKLRTLTMVIVKGGITEKEENEADRYNQGEYNNVSYGGSGKIEPDLNGTNMYQLWGGVDNMREENQYMEFAVRRYEAK